MVDDLIRSFLNLHPDTPIDGQEYAVPLRVVKRLLEAGMKVEREACAKLCESADDDEFYFGRNYAEAIRARGQK